MNTYQNKKPLYVTEPAVIDLALAAQAVEGSDYYVVGGDTDFTNAAALPYEGLVVRSLTVVDDTILKTFPHLKHIIRVGVGLDNIDVAFCKQRGIAIYNAPGANADAVVDYSVMVMLLALRKMHQLHSSDIVAWNRQKFQGRNIAEQTIGIVGFGNVGRLLHKKLRGLGCAEFYIFDPYLPADASVEAGMHITDLNTLLQRSTIISLHVPLSPETEYLIGKHNMSLLQQGAIIVNAARGGIVDEAALIEALDRKSIVYVADVVEGEPHINPHLLQHENIIITPHIASLTDTSEREMIAQALDHFLQGIPAKI